VNTHSSIYGSTQLVKTFSTFFFDRISSKLAGLILSLFIFHAKLGAVWFLVSSLADYITGQSITVSGDFERVNPVAG
jgi:hypothetical protein